MTFYLGTQAQTEPPTGKVLEVSGRVSQHHGRAWKCDGHTGFKGDS